MGGRLRQVGLERGDDVGVLGAHEGGAELLKDGTYQGGQGRAVLGTLVRRLRWVRHRCHAAPGSTAAMALTGSACRR
jgi:hypothetical protein